MIFKDISKPAIFE